MAQRSEAERAHRGGQPYVQDRKAGNPWITKLPFPVHVVERVESYDAIRRARLITTYRYRHGHYDTHEREFRGFGYVEQTDAELFGKDHGQGLFPTYPAPINNEIPQAPVLTKTWFHTGAWKERAAQGAQYQTEYWNGDTVLANVPHLECTLPSSFTPQELREAARALRGTTLRTEVYELDGDLAKQAIPHAVSETCVNVRKLQAPQNALGPGRPQLPGVFHTVPKESRSWAYDRVANDPRTSQSFPLEVDAFGVVLRAASLGYPRRGTGHAAEQLKLHCVVTTNSVLHLAGDFASGHRLGIPLESKTFELHDLQLSPPSGDFYEAGDVDAEFQSADLIPYEGAPSGTTPARRLVQHEKAQYYNSAALPAVLAFGSADTRALLYKSYLLDLTPGLLTNVYSAKATAPELTAFLTEGAYVTPAGETGHWLPSGHAVFNAAAFYLPSSVVDPFDNSTAIAYDAYNFFALTITDPLSNVVTATHDYRVLAPKELTDPNGNRQEAAFDALGMIKAMAVKGKVGSSDGDTITAPTVEYSYDYTRWDTAQKPNWVKVKARETHGTSPTPKFQESVVFSDGSGAVVMTKAQAEPATVGGPARYVGTGRTVLNNKGNPVKQYEPYFSSNNEYENEDQIVATGVTPVITYDGIGRVLRTDLPNGTYSRVERSPWLETAYDPNDTVDEPGNRWKTKRIPTALPTPSLQEQRALTLTQLHAATPTKTHMDSLGRAFLVIAHNKVGAADEFHETRTKLDIEGQVLTVTDALGRVCQTNVYSMAGKILKDTNLDKGSRWNFHDVGGALIRRFDDRNQVFRLSYDALRRPTHLHLKPGAAAEVLLQRTVYGDSAGTGITDPKVNNLRGKPIRLFDGAGRIKSESYDFKGNSLTSDRKLATAYTTTPDWTSLASINNVATLDSTAATLLETETFTESREYDALGRVTKVTAPDASQFIPTYNEASLLEKVDVKIRGAASATPFVANIDYDAKGQRTAIIYSAGNFRTDYSYDSLTFRLMRVLTTRISPSETLQDLNYTFDPVGNIIEVTDAAQQSLLFTNGFATVPNKYEYDAVYRLKRGEGREHKSVGDVQVDHNDQAIWNLPHPNDPQAIRSYFETCNYDKIGNILEMFHNAGGGANTWTRTYTYQTGPSTNRLASHNIPGGTATYSYDAHGSMTSMPHLSTMSWTPFDQMQSANKGGGGIVYFTYGADGQRVRKVWDKTASLKEERIYLGGYEVYREKTSGVTQLERQTLHVMDGAKRLAMVETKTISGGVAVTPLVSMFRYQLGNHLGSAVLEVDAAGLIISYEEYSPYGSSAYRSSRSGVDVSARRYRYVGLERDDETGLYSMGARYYAAWLGRWTSADPLGVGADGPGIYNYTRGSPINLIDPGGMDDEEALPSVFSKFFSKETIAEMGESVRSGRAGSTGGGAAESSSSGGEWIASVLGGTEGASIYTSVTKAWREDTADGKSVAGKLARAAPLAIPFNWQGRMADSAGSAATGALQGDETRALDRGVDFAVEGLSQASGPLVGKVGSAAKPLFGRLFGRVAVGVAVALGPSETQAEKVVVREVATQVIESAEKATAGVAREASTEAAATAAPDTAKRLGLGLGKAYQDTREGYVAWAKRMGFKNYKELSNKTYGPEIKRVDQAMSVADEIHFNMEEFRAPSSPSVGKNTYGEPFGSYTDYEYSQLRTEFVEKAFFWLGDKPFIGPHRF